MLPALLSDTIAGNISPSECSEWLRIRAVTDWIGSAAPYELFYECSSRAPGREALAPLSRAASEAIELGADGDTKWVLSLLLRPLNEASPANMESSISALLTLGSALNKNPGVSLFYGEVLAAVRRVPTESAHKLVVICFPIVYSAVLRDYGGLIQRVTWWFSFGWDRARAWREWLIDAWISQGWPPIDLLRAIDGDVDLFSSVCSRARMSGPGKNLLARLWSDLSNEPQLAAVWGERLTAELEAMR